MAPGGRRSAATQRLGAGPSLLDRVARRAWLDGAEIHLTPRALALLDYLMTHPDEVITRDRLLDELWGWEYPGGTRAVDNRVAELRRALGDDAASRPDRGRSPARATGSRGGEARMRRWALSPPRPGGRGGRGAIARARATPWST